MKELVKFIHELLISGKSQDEIDLAVAECEDFATKTPEEIADAQDTAKKAIDSKKAREDNATKKADTDEFSKKVKEGVDAHFKSINIDPQSLYKTSGSSLKKRESVLDGTKQVEMNSSESEVYQLYQKQMKAIWNGDKGSAKKISDEIDDYNTKAAGDPVRTDSDAVGGYAIPTEVDSEIRQLEYAQSVMLQNANTDNIIYNDKIYPLAYGVAVVDITNEATNLTEDLLAMANPTVAMKRFGAFMNVSNEMKRQRGDIIPAVSRLFASARAEFLDYRLAVGNVTNASQLVDGMAFDPNTSAPAAFARAALTVAKLQAIKDALSYKATGKIVFIGNRQVQGSIGLLKDTAGNYIFPNYVGGGAPLAPLGIPFIVNPTITSVLDIGGDDNTGGTDDVLLCADMSKFVVGVSAGSRIEMTDAYDFVGDNTTMKIVGRYGCEVLSATGTAGIVAVAQKLTN